MSAAFSESSSSRAHEAGGGGRRRVDAHQHFWHYNAAEFDWLTEPMKALRRDFLPAELNDVLRAADVWATVAVQARRCVEETHFLLECARLSEVVAGVVGWVPLTSSALPGILDELGDSSKLVGVREIAQGQPRGFLDQPSFHQGIEELTLRDLSYDLLIYADQLPEAIRLVRRYPEQRFVLDHAAKPPIASGELEPWASQLRELAQCVNVSCKISGLVTEADWKTWDLGTLRPYLDTCVEAFGPGRLMAGSDWPVCLVASSYARWWDTLDVYFGAFSPDEQADIFGTNAVRFYRLSV